VRFLTHRQLPNADHDAVVEVSLGSPSIISVFPSEDILRPNKKPALSSTERLEWFVFYCKCTEFMHTFRA
jgi:hypothetical protein